MKKQTSISTYLLLLALVVTFSFCKKETTLPQKEDTATLIAPQPLTANDTLVDCVPVLLRFTPSLSADGQFSADIKTEIEILSSIKSPVRAIADSSYLLNLSTSDTTAIIQWRVRGVKFQQNVIHIREDSTDWSEFRTLSVADISTMINPQPLTMNDTVVGCDPFFLRFTQTLPLGQMEPYYTLRNEVQIISPNNSRKVLLKGTAFYLNLSEQSSSETIMWRVRGTKFDYRYGTKVDSTSWSAFRTITVQPCTPFQGVPNTNDIYGNYTVYYFDGYDASFPAFTISVQPNPNNNGIDVTRNGQTINFPTTVSDLTFKKLGFGVCAYYLADNYANFYYSGNSIQCNINTDICVNPLANVDSYAYYYYIGVKQ